MTDKKIKAWWFSRSLKLPHGDGRQICLGRTHKVKGEIIPCVNGLHASVRVIDALTYAPGPVVWRVEMSGVIVHEDDKLAASERTYLAGGVDVSDTLRKFARLCALDVIHLWDAPDIVYQYLKTGDESIRRAARDAGAAAWAAGAAARATRDAARATRDAARASAACHAAWHTAWDARDATRDAAGAKQNRRLTRMLNELIR